MDSFKLTVFGIALFLLIIIFIIVGVLIYNNNTNSDFPPKSNTCPNYWVVTSDGKCEIPVRRKDSGGIIDVNPINVGSGANFTQGVININTGVPTYLTDGTTIGYDSNKNTIDFSKATICEKMKWANKYGILWDGVNNNNTC